MPRKRSEESIEAEKLYRAGHKLVDIAQRMGKPEGTVRRWKSDQDWDGKKKQTERSEKKTGTKPNARIQDNENSESDTLLNETASTELNVVEDETNSKGRGAPIGNQNAIGNRGGPGAPLENQNSLKHGIYRQALFKNLDDSEMQMIDEMPDDELQHLDDEIALCIIAEKRLLDLIAKLTNTRGDLMIERVVRSEKKREFADESERAIYEEQIQQRVSDGSRLPGSVYEIETTTENVTQTLLKAYSELSRVKSQKKKALEVRHKIKMDKREFAITIAKLSLHKQRLAGGFPLADLVDDDDLGFDLDPLE